MLDQHVLGAVLDTECVVLIPDCAVVDVDVLDPGGKVEPVRVGFSARLVSGQTVETGKQLRQANS